MCCSLQGHEFLSQAEGRNFENDSSQATYHGCHVVAGRAWNRGKGQSADAAAAHNVPEQHETQTLSIVVINVYAPAAACLHTAKQQRRRRQAVAHTAQCSTMRLQGTIGDRDKGVPLWALRCVVDALWALAAVLIEPLFGLV